MLYNTYSVTAVSVVMTTSIAFDTGTSTCITIAIKTRETLAGDLTTGVLGTSGIFITSTIVILTGRLV